MKNLGQVLKLTADKYPDREALVSCSENARLTFAETLDKVIRIYMDISNRNIFNIIAFRFAGQSTIKCSNKLRIE